MSSLLKKLKSTNNLLKQVKEANKPKTDMRFLNYYDLKDGEQLKILFLPDENGKKDLKYELHGPNLTIKDAKGFSKRVAGVPNIGTLPFASDSPVMQKGFDLLELEKQTGESHYKEEAKKWFPREYHMCSVLVLESPFEVNQADDGNDVKLLNMPWGVARLIDSLILQGEIVEEELYTTPFLLTNVKRGQNNNYDTSRFARQPLTDEEFIALEKTMKIDLFNYETIDLLPKTPTVEELEEWLEKAEDAYAKATGATSAPARRVPTRNNEVEDEDSRYEAEEEQEEAPAPAKRSALKDRLAKAKPKAPEVDEMDDDIPFNEGADTEEVAEDAPATEDKSPASSTSALKDRLARLRK